MIVKEMARTLEPLHHIDADVAANPSDEGSLPEDEAKVNTHQGPSSDVHFNTKVLLTADNGCAMDTNEDISTTPSDHAARRESQSSVFVVRMRVLDESSTPAIPQAAFHSQQRARTYALHIFKDYCDQNYDDFIYYGPRQLARKPAFRYTARHGQTRKRLVLVEVSNLMIVDQQGEDDGRGQGCENWEEEDEVLDQHGLYADLEDGQDSGDEEGLETSQDVSTSDLSDEGSTFEDEDNGKVLRVPLPPTRKL